MALKIAIDASRTTRAQTTGTEHYALELTRHLIEHNNNQSDPHQLTLYFRDTPLTDLFPASPYVHQRVIPLRRMWTHLGFAAGLNQDRPDVTFVPAHTLPVAFPGRGVVTVHDLGYRYFPQAHPRHHRLYLDITTRHSVRRATRVLADSDATAADLQKFYNVPADKIRVVYPGVTPPDVEKTFNSAIARVREKYKLPQQYFLFVGTLQPRKNIARLVQAFERWSHANPKGGALVLAGGKGWLFDEAWLQDVPNIYPVGYVTDDDKYALLAGAMALVFPSLYEGFGFPVLEAMHCGTPVITSTTSSLPELAGNAALLVDPLNVTEIATAMDLIISQISLRYRLRALGYRQVERFTWENAALETMRTLEEAAGVRV
jgi:glycosyltransferase involved in cell wall biosynthesis